MCWMCDHSDSSRDDYLDYMRELMACYGWGVQGVEREGAHPPWAYTVGLTAAGQPELVVTGMPLLRATCLLNEQAKRMLRGGLPLPGEPVRLGDRPMIQIVEVAEPTAHLHIAVEMFGPQIRALQVVHADDRDHWPWQPGYRGVRGGQPVLGPHPLAAVTQPTTPPAITAGSPAQPTADTTSAADGSAAPPGTHAGQAATTPAPADAPAVQAGAADEVSKPSRPGQPGAPAGRPGKARQRVPERRTVATRRTSRGSGRRRASRGPRRRSAQSPARPPSRRR
jgi:Domain of unknown function (DUF4262)